MTLHTVTTAGRGDPRRSRTGIANRTNEQQVFRRVRLCRVGKDHHRQLRDRGDLGLDRRRAAASVGGGVLSPPSPARPRW